MPLEHGKAMRRALQEAGNARVDWISYEKEGHGWREPATQTDFWNRVARFLAITAATSLALPIMSATAAIDMPHLPWTRQAVIYQINVRQYSQAGTLKAVEVDLPRIKALGVDILWVMPWQPGMPLIYNGQESGLAKRLEFFEKDAIAWRGHEQAGFYQQLTALKHRHLALAAGQYGAPATLRPSTGDVVAFERRLGKDVVRVAVNLSNTPQAHDGKRLPAWGWDIT